MKKYILLILLGMFIILPNKVKAGNMDSYIDWNLDRSVFAHQYRNGEDHITNLAWITANGKTAYCIEPGIMADKASYYSSSNNISDTNLGNIDTKKLSLIGYFGYGYKNHNTKEYYMATQELIWRFMGVENVWWTDQKEGGNTYDLTLYKNEIMNLVNNYEVAPNFSFKKKYMVGDQVTLNDSNSVLSEYEVLSGNASINGNSITINVEDINNNFTLKRKENGMHPIYYYKSGYQTIGSFEFAYSFEKTYSYNGEYGKIVVDKLDYDTKSKDVISKNSDATLQGAEYGLYKDNNLIESKKTNDEGIVEFDKLKKGSYLIKELSPSKGYTVSLSASVTTLGSTWFTSTIKSYEKIIKNKIVITKVLDDNKNNECSPEEGITFGVYDINGNLIDKKITDKNGNIIFELMYGKYILKQLDSPYGVDKVKDYVIEVKEDGITQNIALVNHKIKKETFKIISTKENINELPNTGNNNLVYYMYLLLFFTFGYKLNEKYS